MSGHTDYIHDISLKSDGNTLASASEDGSVNIWGQCFVYTHTFIKVLFSMKKNCNAAVFGQVMKCLWDWRMLYRYVLIYIPS